MYANKPSVLGLLDKLRVERGSHDSHIYMVGRYPLVDCVSITTVRYSHPVRLRLWFIINCKDRMDIITVK